MTVKMETTSARAPIWSGDRPTSETEAQHRLIDAYIECALHSEPAKVTMAEVARTAGVTRPTLYKHFPNISAIYFAAVRKVFDGSARQLATHLAGIEGLEDQLTAALVFVNAGSQGDNLYARFLRSIQESEGLDAIPLQSQEETLRSILQLSLSTVFEAHPLLEQHRDAFFDLYTRLTISLLYRPFLDEHSIRAVVRLLINGLQSQR